MGKITGLGLVVGIIVWSAIEWYAITQCECLRTNSCDGEDLFISAVLGVGMLAPAGICAFLVSGLFGSRK